MNDTHYIPPATPDRVFNRVVGWLADHGVNLAGAHTLTVVCLLYTSPSPRD